MISPVILISLLGAISLFIIFLVIGLFILYILGKVKLSFLYDPDYRLSAIREIQKGTSNGQEIDWEKIPNHLVNKLSVSRLLLFFSLLLIVLGVIWLIGVHLFLVLFDPDHVHCLDISALSKVLLFPVTGVLPYLFSQLRRVRL